MARRSVAEGEFGIVLPVLFHVESALPLVREICDLQLSGLKSIIIVVDANVNEKPEVLEDLEKSGVEIEIIALGTRVGQHRAIRVGLSELFFRGLGAVVMDADGQDPPSAVEKVWKTSMHSGQPTIGLRLDYGDKLSKKLSGKAFSALLRIVSDAPHNPAMSSFTAVPANHLQNVLQLFTGRRHYLHAILMTGLNLSFVEYHRRPRREGKSGYSFGGRVAHAIDGVVWWSTRPLRVALGLGFFGLLLSLVFLAIFVSAFVLNETPPGWFSTVVPPLLGNSLVLFVLGTLGAYIERLIIQVGERSS